METIRQKVDGKRFDKIVKSKVERIRFLSHAHEYARKLTPEGSSKELEALADAAITIELAFDKAVWGE